MKVSYALWEAFRYGNKKAARACPRGTSILPKATLEFTDLNGSGIRAGVW